MSFKTSSHLTGHHPNTYMEQFCKALHPDLEMGKVCVAWFQQAVKHCTSLLSDVRVPTSFFWKTLKNFIFPDRTTELMSQKLPISIHPSRLSIPDCQAFFLDIVSDYVQRAPRYAAESVANSMLWQVFYSVLGVIVLGIAFVGTAYLYYKYGQPKSINNFLEEFFKSEKRNQYVASRSLRLAKTELRILKAKPVVKKEDVIADGGSVGLVIKIGKKFEFLDSIVKGSLNSVGKFHRLYDNKSKTDFRIESLNKAMKFLDNNCQKFNLVLMFEEDKDYEAEEGAAAKRLSNSPRIKSLSPPTKTSPRFATSTPKQILNTRLEGGNLKQKSILTTKQPNSPRSSSGIPRNVSKTSPQSRKSK